MGVLPCVALGVLGQVLGRSQGQSLSPVPRTVPCASTRPSGGRSRGRASGPRHKPGREPPVGGGVGGGGSRHLYCLGSCGGAWLSGGGRAPLPPPNPGPPSGEVLPGEGGGGQVRPGGCWLGRGPARLSLGLGQAGQRASARVTEADASDLVSARNFLPVPGGPHPPCTLPEGVGSPAPPCPALCRPACSRRGARGSVPGRACVRACVRAPAAVGVAAVPAPSTPGGPGRAAPAGWLRLGARRRLAAGPFRWCVTAVLCSVRFEETEPRVRRPRLLRSQTQTRLSPGGPRQRGPSPRPRPRPPPCVCVWCACVFQAPAPGYGRGHHRARHV